MSILAEQQIDAMAETLWDFAWNSDPNDPHFMRERYADASKPARDHYREWAVAIYVAAGAAEPQHTFGRGFSDRARAISGGAVS